MPKNKIQFQKGYSIDDFYASYGTEEQCRQAVYQMKWPEGFVCPRCDNKTHCILRGGKVYQCHKCKHQTTLIAHTVFAGTKLPLKKWFLAIYLVSQEKGAISSLSLGQKLGISQNSAWAVKHKLMQVMLESEQDDKLSGRIEVDDAYIGGKKSGGKRGRGSENKKPFIVAVQTSKNHKPQKIKMSAVKGFQGKEVAKWAKKSLTPGSKVVSDGLRCFNSVKEASCLIESIVVGKTRKSSDIPAFKWVNTMLGNIKTAIVSTYHSIEEKHLPRYFAEFSYRFNRRYDLKGLFDDLCLAAINTLPMPTRLLKIAEARW